MLGRTKYYLTLYREFIKTCFIEAMSFRMHFVLLIVMDVFFYASVFATVDIIYNHVQTIGTWNREQLMFFMSFVLAVNHLQMSFLAPNFWELSLLIRQGGLDFILVKPASSLFSVYFRRISAGSTPLFVIPWSCMIYFGIDLGFSWLVWVILPFLVALAFMLTGLIEIIISCSMFWMLEGTGINFLRMQLQQVSRWPDFIYANLIRKVLTFVIPVLLIFNAPNRFLFDIKDWIPLAGMIAAITIGSTIVHFLWRICLNAYESASS
ncbi:MAG: ABC-2 family transporter protein [Proteobacteria bacterium]|nr:ABC-2 family transporter protein [Pseudomonadota bacterium]